MKIIGLTGPTGSGKSSLKGVAESLGIQVIDCDKIARKATEKDTEGLTALVNAFGRDILLADGGLNRRALAKKAFSSKEKTELLNQTLLPYIVKLVLADCKSEYVLLDAPTLIESGLNKKCSNVIGVLADREIRHKRIRQRDKISESDALLRINAGKTDEFYKQNTDFLIYNNGDISELQRQFADILTQIKER